MGHDVKASRPTARHSKPLVHYSVSNDVIRSAILSIDHAATALRYLSYAVGLPWRAVFDEPGLWGLRGNHLLAYNKLNSRLKHSSRVEFNLVSLQHWLSCSDCFNSLGSMHGSSFYCRSGHGQKSGSDLAGGIGLEPEPLALLKSGPAKDTERGIFGHGHLLNCQLSRIIEFFFARLGPIRPTVLRYDTRCYFNVSRLNLPHGNDN